MLCTVEVRVSLSYIFLFFLSVWIFLHTVPTALLLGTEPNGAFLLLSATCHLFSLSLFHLTSLALTPPPRISLLSLTTEVQRETYMFASVCEAWGGE